MFERLSYGRETKKRYKELGVLPGASVSEVKRGFLLRAREVNPDMNPAGSSREYAALTEAYKVAIAASRSKENAASVARAERTTPEWRRIVKINDMLSVLRHSRRSNPEAGGKLPHHTSSETGDAVDRSPLNNLRTEAHTAKATQRKRIRRNPSRRSSPAKKPEQVVPREYALAITRKAALLLLYPLARRGRLSHDQAELVYRAKVRQLSATHEIQRATKVFKKGNYVEPQKFKIQKAHEGPVGTTDVSDGATVCARGYTAQGELIIGLAHVEAGQNAQQVLTKMQRKLEGQGVTKKAMGMYVVGTSETAKGLQRQFVTLADRFPIKGAKFAIEDATDVVVDSNGRICYGKNQNVFKVKRRRTIFQ